MIDRTIIEKIIGLGVMAPSGGNSKPWQFRVRGDTVEIFALPEKDHRILNFRNRGTWIAHGALIENMVVAAHSYGYETMVAVFPEKEQPNLTTRITFHDGTKNDETLAAAIPDRVTNRKPYASDPLTPTEKEALLDTVKKIPGAKLKFIEDRECIRVLGAASSVNEIITLEDRHLHALFVHEIAWTAEEEKARGGGLFLKAMELPPPQEFILTHVLRHWNAARVMGKLGFAHMVARDNAKIYSQAAAIGSIMVPDADAAFIDAGRAMERMWLEATKRGLSVQLMTGILFMHQRLNAGDSFGLSRKHIKMAEGAYGKIAACVRPEGAVPAILFRIGRGDAPSAYSIKTPAAYIE